MYTCKDARCLCAQSVPLPQLTLRSHTTRVLTFVLDACDVLNAHDCDGVEVRLPRLMNILSVSSKDAKA